jgi:hypothetical protein
MLKTIYSYEAWGKYHVNIQINVDVDREFTDTDKSNMYPIGDQIVKSLMEETYNLDPKNKIKGQEERNEILSVFGDRAIYVEEIPNGYCPDYCCKHLPWFIVTTNKGRIKIGWRKRVISIDWEDSIIDETGESLFPDEDVTKYNKNIHAWGIVKAKEYIDKLLA